MLSSFLDKVDTGEKILISYCTLFQRIFIGTKQKKRTLELFVDSHVGTRAQSQAPQPVFS